MKSSIDHPFAYFDWYFTSRIKKDKDVFYAGIVNEVSNGLHEIDERNHIIMVVDSYDNKVSYSFESTFKNKTNSELIKAKEWIDLSIQNIYANKSKVLTHINFLKKKINLICNDKLIKQFPFLESFVSELTEYVNAFKLDSSYENEVNSNNSYFDIRVGVKQSKINALYEVAIDEEIIDDEIVTEQEFYNVLSVSKPIKITDRIHFKVDNQIAVHFLISIEPLFNGFSFSKIAKSQLFLNKLGKVLNQSDLSTAKTRLKVRKDAMLSDITIKTKGIITKI